MAKSDSLEKIKEAEIKAIKIIEKANEERNRLIVEAQKRTLKIPEKYEQKMKRGSEAEIKKIQQKNSKQQEIKKKEILDLKKNPEKMIKKELNFLHEKFIELVLSD